MQGLAGEKTVLDEISNGLDSLLLGGVEMNSRAYATMFGFRVSLIDVVRILCVIT